MILILGFLVGWAPALNAALDIILVHDCWSWLRFHCRIPMGHFELWDPSVPQILNS